MYYNTSTNRIPALTCVALQDEAEFHVAGMDLSFVTSHWVLAVAGTGCDWCMLQGAASSAKGKRKQGAAPAEEEEAGVVEVNNRQGTPEEPMILDADPEPAAASTPPAEEPSHDRIASANAYMLVYRRRNWHSGATSRQICLPAK